MQGPDGEVLGITRRSAERKNLVILKDRGLFLQVAHFRVLGLVTLMMQYLDRVILWVIQKEIVLAIN